MCKNCKECLNSRVIISENGYKAICTLSVKESNNCLLNDKCKFEGNPLYLMAKGEWIWLGDNPSPNHKWSCNKCGRGVKEQENFCPNCGAKMDR